MSAQARARSLPLTGLFWPGTRTCCCEYDAKHAAKHCSSLSLKRLLKTPTGGGVLRSYLETAKNKHLHQLGK